jgi:hypothetical protein
MKKSKSKVEDETEDFIEVDNDEEVLENETKEDEIIEEPIEAIKLYPVVFLTKVDVYLDIGICLEFQSRNGLPENVKLGDMLPRKVDK